MLFFFGHYVMKDRGRTPAMVRNTMTFAYLVSFPFYLPAGPMLDFVGRCVTAFLYFSLGSLSLIVCFHAQDRSLIAAAYTVAVAMSAVWGISATITAEIFPTSTRASANAVVNNLMKRIGMVVTSGFVGIFFRTLGTSVTRSC